uniref:C-type lectin domain-containing protein n=1 Tax=Panagrolaimus davidi TaxID=227884 RepID=A0A914PDK8_9BILA
MVAEESCIQLGGHLVSIHDALIDALLAQEGANHFRHSTITDFWIGLTGLVSAEKWSWMDGTVFDFKDWEKGEPKNISGNNCASLSIVDGFWKAENCFELKPYVCKVDKSFYEPLTTTTVKPINCPYPYMYFEFTHSCYGVWNLTNPLNWENAEKYCEANAAHLTSIHSIQEARFLGSFVYVADLDFWSGAFSNDGGLTWKWSDGSTWDYNPWNVGYPTAIGSSCGKMWGAVIANVRCDSVFRLICKKSL